MQWQWFPHHNNDEHFTIFFHLHKLLTKWLNFSSCNDSINYIYCVNYRHSRAQAEHYTVLFGIETNTDGTLYQPAVVPDKTKLFSKHICQFTFPTLKMSLKVCKKCICILNTQNSSYLRLEHNIYAEHKRKRGSKSTTPN